jgi:CRISPR/Cas system CMR-associated protein Cmr3 (group 5 of RAMP superfamily)
MPNEYLRWIMSLIKRLSDDSHIYSEKALKKEKHLIIALSQKVLREVTEKERAHLNELVAYGL